MEDIVLKKISYWKISYWKISYSFCFHHQFNLVMGSVLTSNSYQVQHQSSLNQLTISWKIL
jgi:hypothetical protein